MDPKSGGQLLKAPRKNEAAGPKQKQRSFVDVSGGENKVQWTLRNNTA